MRQVLISGSIAYDTILAYSGRFRDHLTSHSDSINATFPVSMERHWGGCAGNIAWCLKMLGGEPLVSGAVGDDGAPYLERLRAAGIDASLVRTAQGRFTAQAFITADSQGCQICSFHNGALEEDRAELAGHRPALAIVAPSIRPLMLEWSRILPQKGIPFIFDPGQLTALFSGSELAGCMRRASATAVSEYELALLVEKTGLTAAQVAGAAGRLIVTHGAGGTEFFDRGARQQVPAFRVEAVDPVGCGDAFRGGLLYGLSAGAGWTASIVLGSAAGALKAQSRGGQDWARDPQEVRRRIRALVAGCAQALQALG